MDRIQILLADPHALVRKGLRSIIGSSSDLRVVAEAKTGYEIVDRVVDHAVGVVSLELTLQGPGLAATIRQTVERSPATRFLVLTGYDDASYVQMAIAAGVSGFVLKSTPASVYINAIRRVAAGDLAMDPNLELSKFESPGSVLGAGHDLSGREQEVLALLSKGYTHREIAEKLFISKKSVDTYRARLRSKTGLSTRADFVQFGLHSGILSRPDDHPREG